MEPNLLAVCSLAFLVVFLLLSILALAQQWITNVFPERIAAVDAVVVAAISTAVASVYPGARVSRIEEES